MGGLIMWVDDENEKLKLDSNTVVKKSCEMAKTPMKLIELNRGLNLRQQRFFNMAILAVNENGISEFGRAEYDEIFHDDSDKFYAADVKTDVQSLGSLGMQVSTTVKEAWRSVFLEVAYDKKSKTYKFIWSPLMKEHVQDVKKNYIQQDLKTLAHFKNKYSFIWYDFFKSNFRQWKWKVSKEAVINLLRLENKKSYLEHHNMMFKQCIKSAFDELNEFTEYKLDCEIIRQGRTVIGYEFTRITDKKVEVGVSEAQLNVLREIVDRYGDKPALMREIASFAIYDVDAVPYLINLYYDIQTFNRFIAVADSYTQESFSEVVQVAIKKDNAFKAKLREVYRTKSDRPIIDEFLQELEKDKENPKRKVPEFYNWLDERE